MKLSTPNPLLDLSYIRTLLKSHGLWAKHHLGQNFLVDKTVLQTIVESADIQDTDHVIEIGPGLGVLTWELGSKAGKVTAYEIDDDMLGILPHTLGHFENIEILKQSGLDFLSPETPYKIVANIPYYITGHFLRHVLEEVSLQPTSITLLIQKEVAQKVCAESGELNLVALGVQVFGDPKIIMTVDPTCFSPAPKVDSAILHIDVLSHPRIEKENIKDFFHLVNHCFRQKRKKIRTSLKGYFRVNTEIMETLEPTGYLEKRPQDMRIEDWVVVLRFLLTKS